LPKVHLQGLPNHHFKLKFNIFLARTQTKNTAQNAPKRAISSENFSFFCLGRGFYHIPSHFSWCRGVPPPHTIISLASSTLSNLHLHPPEFQPDLRHCVECGRMSGCVQQALAERHQLQDQNTQLQHRLADVFSQRGAEDTHREEHITTSTDQDKRYLNYMGRHRPLSLLRLFI